MKNIFVTTPGVPSPVVASRFTAFKGERPKVLSQVPAGENVAEVYPWISGVRHMINGVTDSETKVIREGYGSSAFVNNTDRVISIKQLRFFSSQPPGLVMILGNSMIYARMGIKVRHTDFEIVSEWLPCGMLETQNNVWETVARSNLCMSLPTPYYLQSGHTFRTRIRSTNPFMAAANYSFSMTLFGKDPKNGKPYELCKQVTVPYRATPAVSAANPLYVDVVFDDNRDYPMRDMLLTHILFSIAPHAGVGYEQVLRYAQQLDFQFMPPEGPKWLDFADWAPVGNLVDQTICSNVSASFVSYRPETPILFAPSQQIDIDVRALAPLSYQDAEEPRELIYEVPLWVTLIGTQEQQVNR
jgi:hypothetical protein